MLFAVFLFTLLGVMVGIVTGLIPGVHVNNVALLVYVSQGALSGFIFVLFGWASPTNGDIIILLSSLILSTAVSHTFISFVPSVFLGAPDEDTALSVLPGHRMLLRGKGYEAVLLAARGCLWGFIASLVFVLPLRLLMGSPVSAYEKLRPVMAGVLALVVTLLIYSERERLVPSGRVRINAHEIGGIQLLSDSVGHESREPWPPLVAGEEVCVEGKVAKAWTGGLLLVRGRSRVIVEGVGDWEQSGVWVRTEGIVLPETRTASTTEQRAWALLLFLISGALGWVLLATPGIEAANWFPIPALANTSASMMLFPLFTGLFGLSTMVMSGASRESLPEQEIGPTIEMENWRQTRAVACGTVAGAAVSWFPGVSGASATVISRYLAGGEPEEDKGRDNDREFLVSIGAANAASTIFTLVALFVILKGRSGSAATIGALMSSELSPWEPITAMPLALSLLLITAIVAAFLAFGLSVLIAKLFAKKCGKIRYGVLVKAVVFMLVVMVFLLTGAVGLLVAGAATVLGLLPPVLGVRRVHLMGSLVLPAIILLAF